MKEKVCLLGAVLALVFVCSTVQAGIYYISPTGSDTGAGTIADPWASPSRGGGMRADGGQAMNDTVINVRDTQGYLPSGNLNVAGVGTVAYTSKTTTQFTLASPLAAAVANDALIDDADILGGVGYQPGDTIYLRGGTYSQQRLRLKASGSSGGGHITYAAYPGEVPYLQIGNFPGPAGLIWNDGESAATKTEYIIIDGLKVKADQNIAVNSDAVVFSSVNSSIIRNSDLMATGSAGNQGIGVKLVKCANLDIEHSLLWSKYERSLVQFTSGTTHISYSVIGGAKYGMVQAGGATGTLTGDHLTILDVIDIGCNINVTGTVTNSIMINSAGTMAVGSSAGSDYNNVWNNGTNYGAAWNGGGGAGANDISVDPQFILTGYSMWGEPNKGDPNWLRYDWSDTCATASDTGSWIGAFEPVPEPATLAMLLISGLGAVLLRRRG